MYPPREATMGVTVRVTVDRNLIIQCEKGAGRLDTTKGERVRSNTDWFRDARWGVFAHFLASDDLSAEQWNERVDAFDVNGLAAQLAR